MMAMVHKRRFSLHGDDGWEVKAGSRRDPAKRFILLIYPIQGGHGEEISVST